MFKQKNFLIFISLLTLLPINNAVSEMNHMHHKGMTMDMNTMVMGENKDRLPNDCPGISEEQTFTIKAGRKYASQEDVFAYDVPIINVKPCARITVTLENNDQVRHQWMVHGLPRYLYDGGMFHLEANGGYKVTGTFIVPSRDESYFTHCDIAQHTEKGLKGEVIVGAGKKIKPTNISNNNDQWRNLLSALMLIVGFVIAYFLSRKFL
jgi:FtsP/CotA-like multicopper oxidase with cupredoxin domain